MARASSVKLKPTNKSTTNCPLKASAVKWKRNGVMQRIKYVVSKIKPAKEAKSAKFTFIIYFCCC
jgi:hypothetical protein